ncbi:hypothetical protein [Neoroseomonas rubea]|uniref:hypothetical protein n=1 Tax=Neoroseomonas rubea TaxID=2748666 RepID=UPI0018DF7F3A|nr:hypothetical protein [Roseomonas rubea]
MERLLTYRMDGDRVLFAYGARRAFVPRSQWPARWFLGDFHPDLERAICDWFDATEREQPAELDIEDVIARLFAM